MAGTVEAYQHWLKDRQCDNICYPKVTFFALSLSSVHYWRLEAGTAYATTSCMGITVYNNIQDMTGQGEEWLVIDDEVVAVFYNGNLRLDAPMGNSEVTLVA